MEIINETSRYNKFISPEETPITDGWCGEPVMWGRKVISIMGEELFSKFKMEHDVQYIENNYFVITKKITREEAIEKYGKITNEEFGVRGGWKSVTFGDKKFISTVLISSK